MLMNFTESHLRRMIAAAKGREIVFYLLGGGCVRGVVAGIDTDQDGYIEIELNRGDNRMRFVAPVNNIVAYETAVGA